MQEARVVKTGQSAGFSVDWEAWDRQLTRLGIRTLPQLAAALGIDRVTLWRLRSGIAQPGTELIAKFVALCVDGRNFDTDEERLAADAEVFAEVFRRRAAPRPEPAPPGR